MADTLSTVARLCAERGIDVGQLAGRPGLDEQRVLAIVLGRWTPSPPERDAIAAVFGLTRDQIAWSHQTPSSTSTATGRGENGRGKPGPRKPRR